MNRREIESQIESFNAYVMSKPWFDFDLIACSPYEVLLHGGLDLTVSPEVEINFGEIFFVSLLMTWKTDTRSPALAILDGEDAFHVNARFQVEEGFYLFKFRPEYYSNEFGCLISAKTVSWQLAAPETTS